MKNYLWDIYALSYDSLLSLYSYNELINNMNKKCNFKSNELVLDIGAGTCNLETFCTTKTKFVCLDNSNEMRKRALKKNLKNIKEYRLSNLNKFPYSIESGIYDKVISSNSIYTIKNIDEAFNEINRALRLNGKFILTNSIQSGLLPLLKQEFSNLNLKTLFSLILNLPRIIFILLINIYIDKKFSNTFYSEECIVSYLLNHGFKILEKEYVYADLNILIVAEKIK